MGQYVRASHRAGRKAEADRQVERRGREYQWNGAGKTTGGWGERKPKNRNRGTGLELQKLASKSKKNDLVLRVDLFANVLLFVPAWKNRCALVSALSHRSSLLIVC